MELFCCNYWQNPQITVALHYFQKQPLGVFCTKESVLKKFANFIGKHLCWSQFLTKYKALRPAPLLRRSSNTFPTQFTNFLKTPFSKEQLRLRILLTIPLDCNRIPYLFQLNFAFFLPA